MTTELDDEYALNYTHVKVEALRRITAELDDLKVDPFLLSAEESALLGTAQALVRSITESVEERRGTTGCFP